MLIIALLASAAAMAISVANASGALVVVGFVLITITLGIDFLEARKLLHR